MDPTQDDAFGSLSNGQGGGVQASGVSGGVNPGGTSSGIANSGATIPDMAPVSRPVSGYSGRAGYIPGRQVYSRAPIGGPTGTPVVLNNGKKSRKWMWVLIMVLILGIMVGGMSAILFLGNNSNKEKLISVLESSSDDIREAESFFGHMHNGDVSLDELFSGNDTFMTELVSPVEDFRKQIEEIGDADLGTEAKNLLGEIKNIINKRLPIYNELNNIYTIFYSAYNSADGLAASKELLNNDDRYVADLAQSFYNYFSRRAQIISNMDSDDCDEQFAKSLCVDEYYSEYRENERFLSDGDILASIITELSLPNEYGETFLMSDLVDELSYEVGEMENE